MATTGVVGAKPHGGRPIWRRKIGKRRLRRPDTPYPQRHPYEAPTLISQDAAPERPALVEFRPRRLEDPPELHHRHLWTIGERGVLRCAWCWWRYQVIRARMATEKETYAS